MIQENMDKKDEAITNAFAFADLPEDDDFEEFDFAGKLIRRKQPG